MSHDLRPGAVSKTRPPVSAARTFFISCFGTALEFYDFTIYGLAAALVFPKLFFPELDALTGTLVAFASFGAGFLARPLGGIVLGHFGDRAGRRNVLILTLLVMGGSTFLIGCLPGADTIGAAAPLLLILLRLLQGFSAGGEWGGAALLGIESAPAGKRGLWGSFTSMGIGIGVLLGSGVFSLTDVLSGGQITGFAWRVPFWIGGLLVLVGLFARLKLPEEERPAGGEAPRVPLLAALKSRPREILLSIGVSYGYNTFTYIATVFLMSYVVQHGYTESESITFQLWGAVASVIAAPLAAMLSDRIGRKPVMVGGAAMLIAYFIAFFPAIEGHIGWLALLMFTLGGALNTVPQGPLPAFLGEQFPASSRYSAISASYQIGSALGGGTAATVATALLIAGNGDPTGVVVYTVSALAVMGLCSWGLRENSRLPMDKIDAGA
ncbi:MFS transporter [Arthrobacter sp. SW1]|uniref:MFS transporter n=1 Tax=Arthrobacter sp. SW1 TaxID=1920889 RepID=UPI000A9415DB|nr:MFS transporter [Arthrobacter sp. SW1]